MNKLGNFVLLMDYLKKPLLKNFQYLKIQYLIIAKVMIFLGNVSHTILVMLLLVTHNVLEAEKVVDRLAIIDKAKIIKMGTPKSFKKYQDDYMVLETFGDPSALINNMPTFVKNHHVVGSRIRSHIKASELTNIISWAMELQQEKKLRNFQ